MIGALVAYAAFCLFLVAVVGFGERCERWERHQLRRGRRPWVLDQWLALPSRDPETRR